MRFNVIPAAPGWKAVHGDTVALQDLPNDAPLDPHVYSREIAAWLVDEDDAGNVELRPLVADGGVVWLDPPEVILAPGQPLEDKRWQLTHPARKEAAR
jgi:hypothetical protein